MALCLSGLVCSTVAAAQGSGSMVGLKEVCLALEQQIVAAHMDRAAVITSAVAEQNGFALPDQKTAKIMKYSITYANLSCERFDQPVAK